MTANFYPDHVFKGDINVSKKINSLFELVDIYPDYKPGCRVEGYFNALSNNLTTLEGGPNEVMGNFIVSRNPGLITLKGGPMYVYGDFRISDCGLLTSFKYLPKVIKGYIFCYGCRKVADPMLLFNVQELMGIVMSGDEVPQLKYVEKYLATHDVAACQNEMIRAGMKDFL